MMKNLIYICLIFLLSGCLFVYDSVKGGKINVLNNSNEPIYTYLEYDDVDSLPVIQSFIFLPFVEPNTICIYGTDGTLKEPSLANPSKKITLFFFTDKLLRTHDFKELNEKQLYTKKVILTEEQLKAMNWEYVYNAP